MSHTDYLKLEIKNIGTPGTWAQDPKKKGNMVLGDIGTVLAEATPDRFARGDKTAGNRFAKLAWLSFIVGRRLTSSTQLYPVEAIVIRNWLMCRNIATGEDEPDIDDLAQARSYEVTLWMEEHWSEIKRQTANRPNKRSTRRPKKSSLPCETPSLPGSPSISARAV